jgi:hypothetical protein
MSSAPTPASSSSGQNTETLKLLAELTIAEVGEQSKDVEHFDRKLGLLMGFALVSVAQIVTALFSVAAQHSWR